MVISVFISKVFIIVGCGIFACYCIGRACKSAINAWVAFKAKKNPNHEANSESTEFVINKKTQKLENASNTPKLPF